MIRALFLLIVLVACNDAFSSSDSTLRIVQISDVQLGFTMARSGETTGHVDTLRKFEDDNFFRKAVSEINSLVPAADVIINTGDIVNDPGNSGLWERYMEISRGFDAPLYEAMGNHDGWNTEGLKTFQTRFGRKDYYSFKIKDCRFIVLNSWYLKYPEINPGENELQKIFALRILEEDHSSYRVIVMHFPAFIKNANENDEYFNLPSPSREWLLNLAKKQNVKLILSGHSHRNIINNYSDSITLITTGPVSEPLGNNDDQSPSVRGFRIIDINLRSGSLKHSFVQLPPYDPVIADKKPGNQDTLTGFSFAFIGDTHYDKPEHHDMKWVLAAHPGDTNQITRYCNITRNLLPGLFGSIKDIADDHAIGLVVHSGDFTEGLCGSFSLARKQLTDFTKFADDFPGVPFLLAKGNHDITGPGADSAYNQVVLPFLSAQAGMMITGSRYTFLNGNMVFFFYDSYDASSLDWLEEQMKVHHDVLYKFVILHEPVIPINARSKWTEFSQPAEAVKRQRLIDLLGKNRAFVLCGHLHCYGLVVRKTKEGAFIQLSGSSVPDQRSTATSNYLEGKKYYGEPLIALEPGFSPADTKERLRILKSEKSRINHFEYAEIQGYIIVNVTNKGISADIYSGPDYTIWKTVNLSELLELP